MTMLVVTHEMAFAHAVADQVVFYGWGSSLSKALQKRYLKILSRLERKVLCPATQVGWPINE